MLSRFKYISAVVLIFGLNVSTSYGNMTSNGTATSELSKKDDLVERWQKFERRVKQIVDAAIKLILPKLVESQNEMNFTSTCIRDSMILIRGLKNLRPWAVSFFDSSGKSFDGVLRGTRSSFGDYNQCLNIEVKGEKSTNGRKVLFHGQHCMLDIKPPMPPKTKFYSVDETFEEFNVFSGKKSVIAEATKHAATFHILPFRLGICVPSGCSLQDVDNLGKLFQKYIYFDISATRCEVKRENEYTPIVVFVICLFSLPVLLTLIGSLIDFFCSYKKHVFQNILVRVLLAFSILANFKKFRDTKVSNDSLKCVNGMRFISMSWIILGHTYFILNLRLFTNLLTIRELLSDFFFQAIVNASVAVDSFFCIGGLLVCYLTVKQVNESGKSLNVKLYIVHRVWRILPVYVCAIGLTFLLDLMGSGPVWHDTVYKHVQNCYSNWWTNLLFVNNFYKPEDMCAMHGWFIACDMQLHIAALIVLIPILRWPKIGLSIAVISIIACVIFSGVWTNLNNLPPTMLAIHADPEQRLHYMTKFYFKPFAHAGPYCIGMLAGYLLAIKPKLQIPKPILVAGWCIAIITNVSVLYGVLEWDKGQVPTFWETLFYSSFQRTAWALGVAWVIVCCCTGHGGVVNDLLSWEILIPLGRLTFVSYLLHPYVQLLFVGSLQALIRPQHFFPVWIFFGHLCVTYGIAFFVSMLIEAPSLCLEKIMLRKKEKLPVASQQQNNLKGSLEINKFGAVSAILPVGDGSVTDGCDNRAFVYRL